MTVISDLAEQTAFGREEELGGGGRRELVHGGTIGGSVSAEDEALSVQTPKKKMQPATPLYISKTTEAESSLIMS